MPKCEYSEFVDRSYKLMNGSETHSLIHQSSGIVVEEHLGRGVTIRILQEANERLWKKIKERVLDEWVRPGPVESAWISRSVVEVSKAITDERAFDQLPILADALEDAGCTNAKILNHSRARFEHPFGCWVLDLLLRSAK